MTAKIPAALIGSAKPPKWWNEYRDHFFLVVSPTVYEECQQGEPAIAAKRLAIAHIASLFPVNPAILEVAELFLEPAGPLPAKAGADAVHIANASLYGCEFLLTWNFRHIANAIIKRRIERILKDHGYEPSTICTPDELMA